jgi:hypothetical protein
LKLSTMNKLMLLAIGGCIALIWYNSAVGFVVLAAGYVLSGPLGALSRKLRGKRENLNRRQV